MSDARHQRFEIDIDEIERQLRRSVDATPNPKPDPLAELARIVGQDDPFRGILGGGRPNGGQARPDAASAEPRHEAARSFDEELAATSHVPPAPASAGHQGDDLLLDDEDLQPLRPRRSRSRLVAVMAGVALTIAALGGFLVWRNPTGGFRLPGNGTPPVVSADQSPLKVAPDKPGGIEVPNQDRQIYDRAAPDQRSRVVDSREQPVDVREAVRNLPASPQVPAPGAGQDGAAPALPGPNPQPGPAATPLTAPPARAAVSSVLGEPRRVRTVAVRPDGSTYTPPAGSGGPSMAAMPSPVVPGAGLPAPVPVTTTTIPVAPPTVAPAAPAPAPSATAPAATAETAPSGPAVTTLPPQRPKGIGRGADAGDAAAPAAAPPAAAPAAPPAGAAPSRVASAEASPAAAAPPRSGGGFAVQLAVRPSEQEARAAYTQLLERFGGDLEGRPATVTEAQVAGKTVHRIRVGPMSKDAATALCTRLKASGGQCFVAGT